MKLLEEEIDNLFSERKKFKENKKIRSSVKTELRKTQDPFVLATKYWYTRNLFEQKHIKDAMEFYNYFALEIPVMIRTKGRPNFKTLDFIQMDHISQFYIICDYNEVEDYKKELEKRNIHLRKNIHIVPCPEEYLGSYAQKNNFTLKYIAENLKDVKYSLFVDDDLEKLFYIYATINNKKQMASTTYPIKTFHEFIQVFSYFIIEKFNKPWIIASPNSGLGTTIEDLENINEGNRSIFRDVGSVMQLFLIDIQETIKSDLKWGLPEDTGKEDYDFQLKTHELGYYAPITKACAFKTVPMFDIKVNSVTDNLFKNKHERHNKSSEKLLKNWGKKLLTETTSKNGFRNIKINSRQVRRQLEENGKIIAVPKQKDIFDQEEPWKLQ